jgi:glycosyltransferase involved in cell wall biosynthesis
MRRLNILQLFSRYQYYGGEESSVYRIGDALQGPFDVEYLLASTSEMLGGTWRQKVTLPVSLFYNVEVARKLRRYQEVGRFDLWQVHNVFPAMSPVVYQQAFKLGVPLVHFLHNYRFGCTNGFLLNHEAICEKCIRGNFWPAIANKPWHDSRVASGVMGAVLAYTRSLDVFNKVAKWIAISHFQKSKHVEMGMPEEKIEVVYHFYERLKEPPPAAPQGHALFVGRLSAEKGVMHLLEAWKIMNRPDRRLVVVGEGPELPRLKSHAEKSGLSNVSFPGFLPQEEQRQLWADAAFSIVPSIWYEPFGMVVLEAWSHARAVVAHEIGALPELIEDGRTGLLAKPDDPARLAEAIAKAFDQPEWMSEMGNAGRERLARDFNQVIWLDKMKAIYNSIFR